MSTLHCVDPAGVDSSERAGQYLTFRLDTEIYGVEILKVREIRSWDRVTPIPNTSAAVLGVLNLRGTIVPIIDLRRHFALTPGDLGPTTVVIVVKVSHPRERIMGLLVDAVSDVHNLNSDDLRSAPTVGPLSEQSLVGLAEADGVMITLLDIDALLGGDDFTAPADGGN